MVCHDFPLLICKNLKIVQTYAKNCVFSPIRWFCNLNQSLASAELFQLEITEVSSKASASVVH